MSKRFSSITNYQVTLPVSIFLLIIFFTNSAYSQINKVSWFPDHIIFPQLGYDLLETQIYSGIFYLAGEDESFDGAYIPVNLGFTKPLINWKWAGINLGLALGVASYTQFEIERYNANTLRGGLLNNDYKAAGFLFAGTAKHKIRVQLFHMSSHLGDDYMLRNAYFEYNDKTKSYEQVDLIYYFDNKYFDLYAGIGEVISPNAFRKRFMIQGGVQEKWSINPHCAISSGLDIKLYEENGFHPDLHGGFGIVFMNDNRKHITFSADGYYGALPYSTLDYGQVWWVGISTVITFIQ